MIHNKKFAASLFTMTTAFSMVGINAPAGGAAAPVEVTSFEFRTTVDATSVGGDAATPMRYIFQFNPDLVPGSGDFGSSENGTFDSYGPLEKVIIEVGSECVAASGGGTAITVFNNAGATSSEDSIDLRAANDSVAGKQMFGLNFIFTRVLLGDSDGTMFTDTALPTSTTFADAADFQQTEIELAPPDSDNSTFLIPGDAPYSLSIFAPDENIGSLVDEIRALQVGLGLTSRLSAPLEDARREISGTLSQKNVGKATQHLQRFISSVEANRTTLGGPTADSLKSSATAIIESLPACA